MRYIAKPGGWFKAGTIVELVADYGDAGLLLKGTRVAQESYELHYGHEIGDEYEDEELCAAEEVESVGD